MRRLTLVLLLIPLAACGPSPRANCEYTAKRDLRAIDALIFELNRNLHRGYAVEDSLKGAVLVSDCTLSDGASHGGPSGSCAATLQTVERPRAILPAAERQKLKALEAKRARILRPTAVAIMDCRRRFPEG